MTENPICPFCNEPVTGRARLHGFTGYEDEDGEIVGRETLFVVHTECYMARTPEERLAQLDEADEGA